MNTYLEEAPVTIDSFFYNPDIICPNCKRDENLGNIVSGVWGDWSLNGGFFCMKCNCVFQSTLLVLGDMPA